MTGSISGFSSFFYHVTIAGWLVAILILVLATLAWSSAIRLAAHFSDRKQYFRAIFAIPIVWAAIDTLLIYLSPHSSAGSLAYSQMEALTVIQVASLGGVPAITFMVLLGGSVLGFVFGLTTAPDGSGLLSPCVLSGLLIASVLIFGALRLQDLDESIGPPVTLIATEGVEEFPESWDAFWDIYGEKITQSSKAGSTVVLPEDIVRLSEDAAASAARNLAQIASRDGSTLVVGVSVEDTETITRRALVALPDGNHYWYVKQHLIPEIESELTPGSRPLVLSIDKTTVGFAICKDMHFPTLGRQYARAGTRLMIVPAYDFDVDDWLTARMTVLRGVEGGFSIARSARNGFSFVSDAKGQVIAERRSDKGMGALEATVPIPAGKPTVYSLIGDVFGWLCVLGWVTLIFLRTGTFRKRSEV